MERTGAGWRGRLEACSGFLSVQVSKSVSNIVAGFDDYPCLYDMDMGLTVSPQTTPLLAGPPQHVPIADPALIALRSIIKP